MYILMKIMKTKQLLTMKNLQNDINANAMKMSKKLVLVSLPPLRRSKNHNSFD